MEEIRINDEIIDFNNYEMDEFDKEIEIEVLQDQNKILEERNDELKEKLSDSRVKLSHSTKRVAVTTVVAAGLAISLLVNKMRPIVSGREKALSTFYEATSDYGIIDDSQAGYIIITRGEVISFDQYVDEAREKVEYLVDSEIEANAVLTTGLKSKFGSSVAKKYLNDSYMPSKALTTYYQSSYFNDKMLKNK